MISSQKDFDKRKKEKRSKYSNDISSVKRDIFFS